MQVLLIGYQTHKHANDWLYIKKRKYQYLNPSGCMQTTGPVDNRWKVEIFVFSEAKYGWSQQLLCVFMPFNTVVSGWCCSGEYWFCACAGKAVFVRAEMNSIESRTFYI